MSCDFPSTIHVGLFEDIGVSESQMPWNRKRQHGRNPQGRNSIGQEERVGDRGYRQQEQAFSSSGSPRGYDGSQQRGRGDPFAGSTAGSRTEEAGGPQRRSGDTREQGSGFAQGAGPGRTESGPVGGQPRIGAIGEEPRSSQWVPLENPYVAFGLTPDATKEAVDKARMGLLKRLSPDLLPEAFRPGVTPIIQQVNGSYDQICRERRWGKYARSIT
jgi:hypothetical protein